jgi:DNA-binding SARP family transcriptional activator
VRTNAPTRLYLLDGFALYHDSSQVSVPESGQRLVALLALKETRLSRAVVAGMLWPETSERRAHASLRTAVWRVQRLCSGLLAASTSDLGLTPSVLVDVREVLQNASRLLSRPIQAGSLDFDWPLSTGELLPGWYDDWVLFERERVRQLHLHILEAVAEALSASGRFGVALEAALRAVQVDPLRESAHRLVMEIHLAEGNIWEALRQYEECSRLLWKELRVAPSGRMRELVQAVTKQVDGLSIQPSGR